MQPRRWNEVGSAVAAESGHRATARWSTQRLTEFLTAVSGATTEASAALASVERAAEILDATVAALVNDDEIFAAVGYPEGRGPLEALASVLPGTASATLEVPGVGVCRAKAEAMGYAHNLRLVVARMDPLTSEEEVMLGSMARVAAMTMRNLNVLETERVTRSQVERLALEQAALRRVATLVARAAQPEDLFNAVAREVGHVVPGADFTMVARYDAGRHVEVVGGWDVRARVSLLGRRSELGGQNVSTSVFQHRRPARIDHIQPDGSPLGRAAGELGMRSAVGAPINVSGRLWGLVIVASRQQAALPIDTEDRLVGFTELIATAIANAQARQELNLLLEEQAALGRVATAVARSEPPRTVFQCVAEEAGRLLRADICLIGRYGEGGVVSGVVGWDRSGEPVQTSTARPGGRNVTTVVYETARPARMDNYTDATGEVADYAQAHGFRSAAGAPISQNGRLWGVAIVAKTGAEPLPRNAEQRLAQFTDLVATAIANAEAREELKASRVRIVASAAETRRRIERDLHDGAQQRLVSLGLEVRALQASVPHDQESVRAGLDRLAAELANTSSELREFARGIHPAILTEGGLLPAVKALARRASLPVALDMRLRDRLPEHFEETAYYVVCEALTNATKHAHASSLQILVEPADVGLRVVIDDDGVGGADPRGGTGLVGLRDRAEALGGSFILRSPVGCGTTLVVELPVDVPGWPTNWSQQDRRTSGSARRGQPR